MDLRIIIKLSMAVAIVMIGVDMQHANADDNNEDGKNSCNDHHHDPSSHCSHDNTTPFILPFP